MSVPVWFLGATVVALGALAARDASAWWHVGVVTGRLDRRGVAPAPPVIRRLLHDAGVDGDARRLFVTWIAVLAVGGVWCVVSPGGLLVVAAVAIVPPGVLLAARGRGDRLRRAQLPHALDVIAGSLRSGTALATAIADAGGVGGRLGAELGTVARHSRDGMPLATVVAEWAGDRDPDTALAGAALTLAATLGGPGADAIDAAAASLRDRQALAAEATALSVQARLSAGVLTVAPVVFAFLLISLDPTSARFLLTTSTGWLCIVVGLTLDVAGALWMGRLVRGAR